MGLIDQIKSHAKLVAKDVKARKVSAYSEQARDFMGETPDAVLGVIDLVHREINRKKSNEAMIYAYVTMFANGMEGIRYAIERGQDWAVEIVDAVRELLVLLTKGGIMPPHLLMLLLNGFIEAKITPGDELTELLGDVALDAAQDQPEPTLADIEDLFASMVDDVGGNEFDVQAAIAEISKALPPEFRAAMLSQITTSDNPVLRDTATLYLLDPAPEVRRTVCQLIAEHASPSLVSPVALRRMIALRNWLPENERNHLDAAIKKSRHKQVECAPWQGRLVEEIIASNIDGVGAQSVFAVSKEGRKYVISSLLVKHGVGIADAWCLRGQSKAEVKKFLGMVRSETESHPIDPGFLDILVPHYLAVGQKNGNVPVAGFLDFVETIGIENWQPREFNADDLLALMEPEIAPARLRPAAVAKVIEASIDLDDEFDFLESWFEQDAKVEAILSKNPASSGQVKVNAIMKLVLEPNRALWTERFLWTALWLKQGQGLLSPWVNFFVIGRELHQKRPVKDIPVMRGIAEMTVMAGMMGPSPF